MHPGGRSWSQQSEGHPGNNKRGIPNNVDENTSDAEQQQTLAIDQQDHTSNEELSEELSSKLSEEEISYANEEEADQQLANPHVEGDVRDNLPQGAFQGLDGSTSTLSPRECMKGQLGGGAPHNLLNEGDGMFVHVPAGDNHMDAQPDPHGLMEAQDDI